MPDEVNYRETLAYSHACQEGTFIHLSLVSLHLVVSFNSLTPPLVW